MQPETLRPHYTTYAARFSDSKPKDKPATFNDFLVGSCLFKACYVFMGRAASDDTKQMDEIIPIVYTAFKEMYECITAGAHMFSESVRERALASMSFLACAHWSILNNIEQGPRLKLCLGIVATIGHRVPRNKIKPGPNDTPPQRPAMVQLPPSVSSLFL